MGRIFFFLLLLLSVSFSTLAYSSVPLKILAIGNSFSEDAVEQNLWELINADGGSAIIGNMYIPGCSLERHALNARSNKADYAYRKIGLDGIKTNTKDYSLEKALGDEDWDYVSVQQVSGLSGIYESYSPFIDELISYVRSHVSPSCRIIFHQTWAYQSDSRHGDFPRYGNDQKRMYTQIIDTARKICREKNISIVVPSGTAIQNARTTLLGDTMTRDGYHLNLLYGRYAVACAWYEIISGKSVLDNSYAPDGMTEEQVRLMRKSAVKAVKRPWKISHIK